MFSRFSYLIWCLRQLRLKSIIFHFYLKIFRTRRYVSTESVNILKNSGLRDLDTELVERIYRAYDYNDSNPICDRYFMQRLFRRLPRSDLFWEPYTVAERIINMIKQDNKYYLCNFLDSDQRHLERNVEDFPWRYNHTLRQKIALYLSYLIGNDRDRIEKSFKELCEIWDDVCESGILCEGSSHYQIILYLWVKDLSDIQLTMCRNVSAEQYLWVKNTLQLATDASDFWIVGAEIPLFGDISPDRSPSLCMSSFRNQLQEPKRFPNSIVQDKFLRINCDCITLFLTIWTRSGGLIPTHDHDDFGHCVIFFNQHQLIFNRGRPFYKSGSGVSREHHNFPCIINSNHQFRNVAMDYFYRDQAISISYDDKSVFLERKSDNAVVIRSIRVKGDAVEIMDELTCIEEFVETFYLAIPQNISQKRSEGIQLEYRIPKVAINIVYNPVEVEGSFEITDISTEYGTSNLSVLAVKLRYMCSSKIVIRVYGI